MEYLECSIVTIALITLVALIIDSWADGELARYSKVYAKVAKWWIRCFLVLAVVLLLLVSQLLHTDGRPTVWNKPASKDFNNFARKSLPFTAEMDSADNEIILDCLKTTYTI